jgi:hypothetical protein
MPKVGLNLDIGVCLGFSALGLEFNFEIASALRRTLQ